MEPMESIIILMDCVLSVCVCVCVFIHLSTIRKKRHHTLRFKSKCINAVSYSGLALKAYYYIWQSEFIK